MIPGNRGSLSQPEMQTKIEALPGFVAALIVTARKKIKQQPECPALRYTKSQYSHVMEHGVII